MKKVNMKPKPSPTELPSAADDWVTQASESRLAKDDSTKTAMQESEASAPAAAPLTRLPASRRVGESTSLAQASPPGADVRPTTVLIVDEARQPDHNGNAQSPTLKRLTIDIDPELHVRIKMTCAARGRKMADEIRLLLEEAFKPV